MIQFNLLPDVKIEFIKARRTKQLVMMSAAAVGAASLAVLIILCLVVFVFQAQHLGNLQSDITRDSQKLEAIPDLDKILTVQNQLTSLGPLHDQKPVASRLSTYLGQITPKDVAIATLNVDFVGGVITISGTASNLSMVNTFVDTLKFTDYEIQDQQPARAFSNVVLSSFGKGEGQASYQINLKFIPAIFDSRSPVTLKVPTTITTRSATEKPTDLFQEQPESEEE